ncbi:MAG: hypothetical protein NC098_01190 [Lachnoclostridium sp.]|nr:hypothetical protein [Lachnoclostridium sp.]
MNKTLLYILLSIFTAVALSSCRDDIDFRQMGVIPEGNTIVSSEINFMPMTEASLEQGESRATVAPPGNGFNELTDMCVLLYRQDRSLYRIISYDQFQDTAIDDETRRDPDADNGISAESMTKKATFKMDVPFGRYYIYVVANLGRWGTTAAPTTTTLHELETTYADEIGTIEDLKAIQLTWDPSNYRNNRQMIGPMTLSRDTRTESLVTIDRDGMQLYAWVKRVASKVTIDFDGSGLRKDIRVYFHKATIRDIPRTAPLANANTIKSDEDLDPLSSHHLDYGIGDDYEKWPYVTCDAPQIRKSVNGGMIPSHAEDAYALYFYENQQGDFRNDPQKEKYDKRQYASITETVLNSHDVKDNVPYGTYIEVEGYYVSRAHNNVSNGRIRYRFMLGRDITYDFNADRNTHYKLTMHFRGNANDIDWHIDYDEDFPDIFTPDIYYISNIYNRKMVMPVRVNEGSSYKLVSLESEVLANNWAPSDPKWNTRPVPDGKNYRFTWNTTYWLSHKIARPADLANEESHPEIEDEVYLSYNKDIYHGFLSMRNTHNMVILEDASSAKDSLMIRTYWEQHNLGKRTYTIPSDDGVSSYDSDAGDGAYEVERNDSTLIFNVPFYTREKQMSPYLAWTGNNPYPYPRHAVVRFTATFRDLNGQLIYRRKRVIIEQVVRAENPKAIWRSHDNDEEFEVVLMERDINDVDRFVPYVSDGPWRAEIVGDNSNWIRINGSVKTVYGADGDEIRFTFKPTGTISADRIRTGGIRIYYNNYTCVHLIPVRQGYAPAQIPGSDTKWVSYAMYRKGEFTKSPLDPGSYFRWGNLNQPIAEENNNTYPLGVNVGSGNLKLAGGGTVRWDNMSPRYYRAGSHTKDTIIDGKHYTLNYINYRSSAYPYRISPGIDDFGSVKVNGKTYHVAEYDDYMHLLNNCEMAYGVLYADGATKTADNTTDAFGFWDPNNTITRQERGMRGAICYAFNTDLGYGNAEQVFFPIGVAGHGRRKAYYLEGTQKGTLRYGDVHDPVTQSNGDPRVMIYDLNQTEGAMYWLRRGRRGGHLEGSNAYPAYSWDINYYTYAFGSYHWNNFSSGDSNGPTRGSDALFIKWVEE